jgi:hypothetical protein
MRPNLTAKTAIAAFARGLTARLKKMLGRSGACEPTFHYEDIKSLSNAEPAVRRAERVELPLVKRVW